MSTKASLAEPPALAAQVENLKARKAKEMEDRKRREEELKQAEAEDTGPSIAIEEERPCVKCGATFNSTALCLNGVEILRKQACDDCIRAREMEEEIERAERESESRELEFRSRWEKICPPRYREPFSAEKLVESLSSRDPKWTAMKSREVREVAQKVLSWRYSDRGIGLVGESGHGKTRLMFSLMERYLREGRGVYYINLAAFGREVGAKFGESAKDGNEWIKRICRAPVVFLDDVGKEKLTERVETELYGIIEHRSSHMLPIFFTANSRGSKLVARMKDDDGELSDRAMPILRRLREFCEGFTI